MVSGQSVSLEELERGVYFISLELDNQQHIERIIKQ
ncbi:MAG: T9SS type A sorting domain-containing protein [Fluviicola sp.]